ncbi:MAG: uracil-DNA glycosylase [Hyphomonadaceae bacterium]|nr:MAG: uracil-DNA glycosylase [Hyphomonadaceae bacterium]KAF0185051.1 MAG: uracil-DNA glycosylase [Hyphomonadaceae bacterium]
MTEKISTLLHEIRNCKLCEFASGIVPRPFVVASQNSKILIAGQAPSKSVYNKGIPWNDSSGRRLRSWLGIDEAIFYDANLVALVPMGFCYPGYGKDGDLPPRRECRDNWHDKIFELLENVKLKILVGKYAQDYHLGAASLGNLTKNVSAWRSFGGEIFPIPHPSSRNSKWFSDNSWFAEELIPELRTAVQSALK